MSPSASMRNCSPTAIFLHNQDIDQFMAFVFEAIGMNGNRPEDRYKQMTSWGAIRKTLKKDI